MIDDRIEKIMQMIKERPFGITLFVIFGLLVAAWFLFMAFGFSDGGFSLAVGMSWLILNFFLFRLKNWARIAAMILSVVVFLVWLDDLVAAFTVDRFFGIGVIFYSPGVFLGVWAIIYFNLPKVKKKFKWKGEEQ